LKTGILFDLDGTLLNTLEDLTDAVNYTMRFYNCPERTMEEVRAFVGNGVARLIRLSLPGKDTDPDPDEVLKTYLAYYAAHSQDKTRPYDGILEALEEIRKVFPVAIVSNKSDAAVKKLCRDYFGPEIFALGELPTCPRKPAPDMVYQGMAAIGAERCIYVGDSEVDVLTAQNADVPCLSVLWGFRDKDCLTAHGAAHFCDDPKHLLSCLKEMVEHGQ
jgi:phosphoglycolate phosphatase